MDRTTSDTATPRAPAHPDPVRLLHECEHAALEREGIAMFVGVHDSRPSARPLRDLPQGPTDAAPRDPDAERLRELWDVYAAALAPGREQRCPSPDPTGGGWSVIEVLLVLSEHHLRAPVGLAHPGPVT